MLTVFYSGEYTSGSLLFRRTADGPWEPLPIHRDPVQHEVNDKRAWRTYELYNYSNLGVVSAVDKRTGTLYKLGPGGVWTAKWNSRSFPLSPK